VLTLTLTPTPPQRRLPLYCVGQKSAAHSAAYRAAVAPNRARSAQPVAATPRCTSARHSLADPAPVPPRSKQASLNADARRSEGCTRMSGQSPFARIPSYPRAFAFPLPVAPASPAQPQRHIMLPRGQLFWPSAPASQASHTPRARAAGPRAPAIRPSQGAPTPGPVAPFKPFRTDPLNREPAPKPAAPAPFKPFRTDPLNREPAVPPNPTYFTPTRAAAVPQHDMAHAPRCIRPTHPPTLVQAPTRPTPNHPAARPPDAIPQRHGRHGWSKRTGWPI
jgi:hypothetical protein